MGRNILSTCSRVYTPEQRIKLDDRDDHVFFEQPRMMHHIDAPCQQQLQEVYHSELQEYHPRARILDLCSSAHSHLPTYFHPSSLATSAAPSTRSNPPTASPSTPPAAPDSAPSLLAPPPVGVLGHGMNGEELAANPALAAWFIQDLNRRTILDLPSGEFHAVLCCCGVQYLQWPEEVFSEVLRVLQPGGHFIVSFSAACWAEKATAGWLTSSMEERMSLLCRFLEAAGFEVHADQLVLPEVAGAGAGASSTNTEAHEGFGWAIARRPRGAGFYDPASEPADAARDYVPAHLTELDLRQEMYVSDATLERWRGAYQVMAADAMDLGIPASAIPQLPADADAAAVKKLRDHLQDMIASFLSACL